MKACNFIKKRPQHRCFPVSLAKFLRISFLWNTSGGCFCYQLVALIPTSCEKCYDFPHVILLGSEALNAQPQPLLNFPSPFPYNQEGRVVLIIPLSPFQINVPFLYLLERSENLWKPRVHRRYKIGTLARNLLSHWCSDCRREFLQNKKLWFHFAMCCNVVKQVKIHKKILVQAFTTQLY